MNTWPVARIVVIRIPSLKCSMRINLHSPSKLQQRQPLISSRQRQASRFRRSISISFYWTIEDNNLSPELIKYSINSLVPSRFRDEHRQKWQRSNKAAADSPKIFHLSLISRGKNSWKPAGSFPLRPPLRFLRVEIDEGTTSMDTSTIGFYRKSGIEAASRRLNVQAIRVQREKRREREGE